MITKLQQTLRIIIHLTIWGVLIIFSTIFLPEKKHNQNAILLLHDWLPLIEAVLIFYINYLFLVDKFIFNKRKYFLFIVINLAIIALFRFDWVLIKAISHDVEKGVRETNAKEVMYYGKNERHMGFSVFKSILSLFIPSIIAVLIKVVEQSNRSEVKQKEIENKNLQSELQHLKYQLQPHFFFNSMNNIYSLIELSPKKAEESIHSLSKLMRYMLYDTSREKVRLDQEIDFISRYIHLMEIRKSEHLTVTHVFPKLLKVNYLIAPLLLIPILENAYKHGISSVHASLIQFDLKMADDSLVFNSTNTNFPKDSKDGSGSGIGLENLRKRLALIYPNRHELKTEIINNLFILSLRIKLEKVTLQKIS